MMMIIITMIENIFGNQLLPSLQLHLILLQANDLHSCCHCPDLNGWQFGMGSLQLVVSVLKLTQVRGYCCHSYVHSCYSRHSMHIHHRNLEQAKIKSQSLIIVVIREMKWMTGRNSETKISVFSSINRVTKKKKDITKIRNIN